MKTTLRTTLTAIVTLALAAAVHAQAPVNDECSGALPVTDGDNIVDNTNATLNLSTSVPLSCLRGTTNPLSAGKDVWYTYTAPVTGLRTFDIISFGGNIEGSTTNTDTKLAIFDSCGGNLLACNDDGGSGYLSKIWHFPVTAGTSYIIRFANSRFGTPGPGVMRISAPPAPGAGGPGSDCSSAIPIAGQPLTVPFVSNGGADSDTQELVCDNIHHDGWFAWTPSATGLAVISACDPANNSSITLDLWLYDSPCGGPPLVCNTEFLDPPNPICGPKICYSVVAGHTYYIRFGVFVHTYVASGDISIEVRPPLTGYTPPANALFEPGNCDDPPSQDLNGGCGITPNAFTPINLCDSWTGTASSFLPPPPLSYKTILVDSDWYQFTLATDDVVTITGQCEFPPDASIVTGCPAVPVASSPTWSASSVGVYDLGLTQSLVAGTYAYKIAPQGAGASSSTCSSGNRYWFHITGSAPCPGACCNGTTCSSTAQADCTGSFQGVGTTCGPVGNPTTCCPANFDGVNGLQVADIFAFLNAWFAGSPSADFDGNGTLAVADIFAFLNAWFAGC